MDMDPFDSDSGIIDCTGDLFYLTGIVLAVVLGTIGSTVTMGASLSSI
jgi:hypothetical protein